MHHQKPLPHAHHQFIRKPKRKLSPKQKHQQSHNFKCPHNLIQPKPKEEYTKIPQQHPKPKDQSEVVLDLKNQLSFLKEEMAKIVHAKLQSPPNDHHASKLKLLDYYFPPQPDKPTTPSGQSLHSDQNAENTPSQNEKSIQRELKKIKSKERLKFSKIKKSEKFSIVSPMKKHRPHLETQPLPTASISATQQLNLTKNRKNSTQQTTIEEEITKASQKNKKHLQARLKSLVQQQQNININTVQAKSLQSEKKDSATTSITSPYKQQKPNIYELKMTRLKKQLKEQQQQIENLKKVINQKSDSLAKTEQQLNSIQNSLTNEKQARHERQTQCSKIQKKLTETVLAKNQLQVKYIQSCEQSKRLSSQNTNLKETISVLEHKLKNREIQIMKLEKINKNQSTQFSDLTVKNNSIIESLKKQLSAKQSSYQAEIAKLNKTLQELKAKERTIKQKQIESQNSSFSSLCIKSPRQQSSSSLLSPRNSNLSPKEKELLQVIKMHEKSIQNYQKDMTFLETECKNLHHFRVLSKRLQIILKDTSDLLMNEKLSSLNLKYEKRLFASN